MRTSILLMALSFSSSAMAYPGDDECAGITTMARAWCKSIYGNEKDCKYAGSALRVAACKAHALGTSKCSSLRGNEKKLCYAFAGDSYGKCDDYKSGVEPDDIQMCEAIVQDKKSACADIDNSTYRTACQVAIQTADDAEDLKRRMAGVDEARDEDEDGRRYARSSPSKDTTPEPSAPPEEPEEEPSWLLNGSPVLVDDSAFRSPRLWRDATRSPMHYRVSQTKPTETGTWSYLGKVSPYLCLMWLDKDGEMDFDFEDADQNEQRTLVVQVLAGGKSDSKAQSVIKAGIGGALVNKGDFLEDLDDYVQGTKIYLQQGDASFAVYVTDTGFAWFDPASGQSGTSDIDGIKQKTASFSTVLVGR